MGEIRKYANANAIQATSQGGRTIRSSARVARSSSFATMTWLRSLTLVSLLAFTACAGPHAPYRLTERVHYVGGVDARDPRVGDFYRPDGPGPFPAVLLIHGGSWQRGSRSEMAKFARRFAAAGYAVFNIDYRLAPEHRYPAQLDDVRAAFAWLHEHARPLAVDPQRIAVMGYSAGAHLALLLGLADVDGAPRPRAVVAGAAPSDLTAYPNSPVLAALIGGSGAALPDVYADASPISHVSPDDPPVLLYHGALDGIVDVDQSRRLLEKLGSVGVAAQLFEEPWSGHATAYLIDGDSFRATLAFLAEQMPPG
jgi:acetyl esterase/lipase